MVQNNTLSSHPDGHLLGYEFKALHETLLDVLHVMVSKDKVYLSVQSVHDIVPVLGASHTEVSKVEHDALGRDGCIPSADEFLIHFGGILEGTATEADDVLMTEMRIRGEPEVLRFELVNGIYVSLFHKFCNIITTYAIYLRRW